MTTKILNLSFLFFIIIRFSAISQHCESHQVQPSDFKFITQNTNSHIGWYDEWLQHTGGEKTLPNKLPFQEKWEHPYMKFGLPSAMHEDSHSSDVSNLAGPLPSNVNA